MVVVAGLPLAPAVPAMADEEKPAETATAATEEEPAEPARGETEGLAGAIHGRGCRR